MIKFMEPKQKAWFEKLGATVKEPVFLIDSPDSFDGHIVPISMCNELHEEQTAIGRQELKCEITWCFRYRDQNETDKKHIDKDWLMILADEPQKFMEYCKMHKIPILFFDQGLDIEASLFISGIDLMIEEADKYPGLKDARPETRKVLINEKIKEAIHNIINWQATMAEPNTFYPYKREHLEMICAEGGMNSLGSCKSYIANFSSKRYPGISQTWYPKYLNIWELSPEIRKRAMEYVKRELSRQKQITLPASMSTIEECYSFLDHRRETEIRLINPHRHGDIKIFRVQSFSELANLIEEHAEEGYNFYIGINERKEGGSKAEDVLKIKAVVVDIDVIRDEKDSAATNHELRASETIADDIIKSEYLEKGFKRPVKCMSGNGWQLWSAIPEIEPTKDNWHDIDSKMQQFHKNLRERVKEKFGVNTVKIDNIGDLPRIIKIIGTRSIKGDNSYDRPYRISYASEPLIRNEDTKLRDHILSLEVKEETVKRPAKDHNVEPLSDLDQIKELDSKVERLCKSDEKLKKLLLGNHLNFESRSEAEASLIYKLIYYQFSEKEIFHIMDNSGCSKWKDSSNAYKTTTFDGVNQYFNKNLKKKLESETEKRFPAFLLENTKKLSRLTNIIKKAKLLPFDGSLKKHKIYHITLQIPKNISSDECKRILQETYNFRLKAVVSGTSIFSNKIVLLLDKLEIASGEYLSNLSPNEYLAEFYDSSYKFKPHIAVAEGNLKDIKEFYNSNKDKIDKIVKNLTLEFKPVSIAKDIGTEQ